MIYMRDSVSPEEHAYQMVVQSSASSDLDSLFEDSCGAFPSPMDLDWHSRLNIWA